MATEREREPSMTTLLSGIVGDVQELVRKEIVLARQEVREELITAKDAGIALAIAGAVLSIGALLLVLTLAQGLADLLNWPIWAGYGVVGLTCAIIGAFLFSSARERIEQIQPIPEQTLETMKENVEWIKEKTTSEKI